MFSNQGVLEWQIFTYQGTAVTDKPSALGRCRQPFSMNFLLDPTGQARWTMPTLQIDW
jgi:hypothetical protein